MKKILIIGPSWVGDMVMSQSLYRTLKEQNPDAIIDVLAPAWCKPILSRMPEVNQAIEMPLAHGEFKLAQRYKIGKSLRSNQYTHAYVLPNSAKSALIPFFARIPQRIGWKGESRFGLLNDIRLNKQSFTFMSERYVALAHPKQQMNNSSSLGGLSNILWPQLEIDKNQVLETTTKFSLSTESKVIGLCPGAEFGPAKKWPTKHYAELATQLLANGYNVWLFGSNKDAETTSEILQKQSLEYKNNIVDLAGKTSLEEAIDLLSVCQYVVSNDSGLMHVSAAVGCHVIGIYGSTSPDYTPPLTNKLDIVNTDIECRPCFKRECPLHHLKCLNEISPTSIVERIIND
ncbi:lipopolysaccharide heptosyltransferase II [Vibrio ezurae]|uniref:lipopolysaccharide heptosyltransferase II n=1 Tax=Vibrio ezurae NBRC 102218 TaxID=1219080 RepID=U3B3P1_9VIBR|nr:lipopolysaccharide heptosyltransferase II [Vibrio ezurae]GAD80550.1 lipopolysaccharide heptosyltransferase II [Vibrio ezurae NBRC 102218]